MKGFITTKQIEKQIKGKYEFYPSVNGLLISIKISVQHNLELSKHLKEKAFEFGVVQATYKGEVYTVNGIATSELDFMPFDITRKSRLFDLLVNGCHSAYIYESDLDEPNKKYYTL